MSFLGWVLVLFPLLAALRCLWERRGWDAALYFVIAVLTFTNQTQHRLIQRYERVIGWQYQQLHPEVKPGLHEDAEGDPS